MRNYWLRIFLGALAIFAIGMVGVTLVRTGIATVNEVVEGEGPLEIPLAFVPFVLGTERLGTVQRVVLQREVPRRVSSVELVVDVGDSLLARGLEGCRLAADFEGRRGVAVGITIREGDGKDTRSAFYCLSGDSVPPDLVEFGEAVFEPAEVRVPLYLKQSLVTELRKGFGNDSVALSPSAADSITEAARREVDAALAEAGLRADSAGRVGKRLGDSLRAAARARVDSAMREMADSNPVR